MFINTRQVYFKNQNKKITDIIKKIEIYFDKYSYANDKKTIFFGLR